MDIKKWLSRAYKIDLQIVSKELQIRMSRNYINKNTTTYFSLNDSRSVVSESLNDYSIKIAEAEQELEKEKTILLKTKQEIKTTIDKVSDVCCRVLLEQRYLACKSWTEIAELMGYSKDYIQRDMHRRALIEIMKTITP